MKNLPNFHCTFGSLIAFLFIATYAWLFQRYSLIPNSLPIVLGFAITETFLYQKRRGK